MSSRHVVVLLSLLFALAVPRTRADEQVLNGIAAVVNSDVITYSQVQDMVGPRENALVDTLHGQELADKVKELRMEAVQVLIDNQLILQEFTKNKYSIPQYYVDEQVQERIKSQFGGDRQAFIRTLAAQGMTMDRFRKMVQDDLVVTLMRQEAIKQNTIIAPGAIEDYYRKNIDKYTLPEKIHLRMIVIKKNGDSGKEMAEEVRQKALGGADFDKLAELYSEDPTGQANQGDWGWIDDRTLNEGLTKIAFSLKPGEVSDVVELAGNYYLLYVEAKQNASTKSLAEVHDDIENQLLEEERQKAQEKWIAGLRQKAYIWIDGVTPNGSHSSAEDHAAADVPPTAEN